MSRENISSLGSDAGLEMSAQHSTAKSLIAGMAFPALFAVYTLWFAAIGPHAAGADSKILASIQFTAIMTSLLVAFCIPHIVYCCAKEGIRKALRPAVAQLASIARLSAWTLFGPALWATAVALLEPTPATWLELGLIPIFTLLIGSLGGGARGGRSLFRQSALTYVAMVLLAAGVATIFIDIFNLTFLGLAVLIGFSGALSTALAGREIERITAGSDISFSLILFARFFVTAIVFTAIAVLFSHGFYLNSDLDTLVLLGFLFFVLPNYLYVYLIWRTNLRHSAYMWALLPIFISAGERLSGLFPPTLSTGALLTAGAAIFIGALCNLMAEKTNAQSAPSPVQIADPQP